MTIERKDYDTKEGIVQFLKTLAGLLELQRIRREAGYERREKLEEFYLFGRWCLDTCGNFSKIVGGFIPKEQFPEIPDVLTKDEFWDFLKARVSTEDLYISYNLEGQIPPVRATCFQCKKPWGIRNCHDMIAKRGDSKIISLGSLVGMNLQEVKDFFGSRTDAVYNVKIDHPIRSDRFIDLNQRPGFTSKVPVNSLGLAGKKEGITDSYVIQEGDELAVDIWDCFHGECNLVYMDTQQRKEFFKIFLKAGYADVQMRAIPNQYCPCEVCAPWYEVTTSFGIITIGWRKRVINIDWSKADVTVTNVPGESDVTSGKGYTHAWGLEKATEYLRRIRLSAETVTA